MLVANDVSLVGFLVTVVFGVALGLGFSIGAALYGLVGLLFNRRPARPA